MRKGADRGRYFWERRPLVGEAAEILHADIAVFCKNQHVFERDSRFAKFIARICSLSDMKQCRDLRLCQVVIFPQRADTFQMIHLLSPRTMLSQKAAIVWILE